MIKITAEELVRYLYNETSELKASIIKAAIETDWNLRETYEELLSTYKNLNEASFSPRSEVINKILGYAAKKQEQVPSH